MNIFHSLKFRFIALGVALILVGVIVRVFFALPFAQSLLRELVEAQQSTIATYVARDIDNSVLARRRLLTELSTTFPPAILNQPDHLARWVSERQRINPLFTRLVLLRPEGKGVFAQYPMVKLPPDFVYSDTDWFQAAMRADVKAPVMSAPHPGIAAGGPVLVMAVPVRENQRVVAVLAGVVALSSPGFLDRLQDIRLGATGGSLLISPADKIFIGSSDPSMILKPTPPPGANLLHDRAMAGYRGSGVTINAFGVEELSTMVSVPSTGWFVVVRMPTAEAFHPIKAVGNFVIVSTLTFVVILVILLLVLPHILRPLTDAARSMREMADGKRPLTPLPIRRQDEVGALVLGFNYLLSRLNDKELALKESEAQLTFMAHHDALTGLYNRSMLEQRIEMQLAQAERGGSRLALLFCDLDGFKSINDQYGHKAGDAVLCEVAVRLSAGRRRSDTVARFGGDEFILLLGDLNEQPGGPSVRGMVMAVARQLLAAVAAPFDIDGHPVSLGVSIGIALSDDLHITPSQLISRADIAMYQAKRAGKNDFCVFEE